MLQDLKNLDLPLDDWRAMFLSAGSEAFPSRARVTLTEINSPGVQLEGRSAASQNVTPP